MGYVSETGKWSCPWVGQEDCWTFSPQSSIWRLSVNSFFPQDYGCCCHFHRRQTYKSHLQGFPTASAIPLSVIFAWSKIPTPSFSLLPRCVFNYHLPWTCVCGPFMPIGYSPCDHRRHTPCPWTPTSPRLPPPFLLGFFSLYPSCWFTQKMLAPSSLVSVNFEIVSLHLLCSSGWPGIRGPPSSIPSVLGS